MKWKLQKNDCRNRGFILDGYPRVYKDAQFMFLSKIIDMIYSLCEQKNQKKQQKIEIKLIKMKRIKMMEMGMNNKARAKTFQDI